MSRYRSSASIISRCPVHSCHQSSAPPLTTSQGTPGPAPGFLDPAGIRVWLLADPSDSRCRRPREGPLDTSLVFQRSRQERTATLGSTRFLPLLSENMLSGSGVSASAASSGLGWLGRAAKIEQVQRQDALQNDISSSAITAFCRPPKGVPVVLQVRIIRGTYLMRRALSVVAVGAGARSTQLFKE